jgi:excisionase family DNA binding protein
MVCESSDNLITTAAAAKRLSVHTRTLRNWVRQGRLPAVHVSRTSLRFRSADVEQFIRSHLSAGSR